MIFAIIKNSEEIIEILKSLPNINVCDYNVGANHIAVGMNTSHEVSASNIYNPLSWHGLDHLVIYEDVKKFKLTCIKLIDFSLNCKADKSYLVTTRNQIIEEIKKLNHGISKDKEC